MGHLFVSDYSAPKESIFGMNHDDTQNPKKSSAVID